VVRVVQRSIVLALLLRDISDEFRVPLAEMLSKKAAPNDELARSIAGSGFFYYWFCEAREPVSGRPALPHSIGRVFGHSEDTVRKFIQDFKRTVASL